MPTISAALIATSLLLAGAGATVAVGQEPQPTGEGGKVIPDAVVTGGTLAFDGRATPGPWRAETQTMTGAMTGGTALEQVRGWVEFPAASLDSDNGRRDRDMRKSLETDDYPTIRFELVGVTEDSTASDGEVWVTLRGTLDIHGVTREVAVPAAVALAGDTVRLRSRFPLNLKDYQIGGLTKMFGVLKMHEIIEIDIDLHFGPPGGS